MINKWFEWILNHSIPRQYIKEHWCIDNRNLQNIPTIFIMIEIVVWNPGIFYFWTKQRNIKYWLHFILHTISKSTVTQNYAHVREGLLWAFKLCSNSTKLNCRENSYADFYVTLFLTHTHIHTDSHIYINIFGMSKNLYLSMKHKCISTFLCSYLVTWHNPLIIDFFMWNIFWRIT